MNVRVVLLALASLAATSGLRLTLPAQLRWFRLHHRASTSSGSLGSSVGDHLGTGGQCGGGSRFVALVPPEHATRGARRRQPYFEGWAIRAVDPEVGVVMVIIASFSAPSHAAFTEHMLMLQYHSRDRHVVGRAFLPADAVELLSGWTSAPFTGPHGSRPAHFTWRIAQGHAATGELHVNGTHARASFALPELAVELSTEGRVPWDARRPWHGPEGWLGRVGMLLPCRYFVHSLASRTAVRVRVPDGSGVSASQSAGPAAAPDARLGTNRSSGDEDAEAAGAIAAALAQHAPTVAASSSARAHLEGNHGTVFPQGWVWVQGLGRDWAGGGAHGRTAAEGATGAAEESLAEAAAGGSAEPAPEGPPRPGGSENGTFVLAVGGLFKTGGVTTRSWIVALGARVGAGGSARAQRLRWDFRTTDGDSVRAPRNACNGSLLVDAVSRDGARRLRLSVRAPRAAFGAPVPVPTARGMSDSPGCSEAHTAKLRVVAQVRTAHRRRAAGAVARGGNATATSTPPGPLQEPAAEAGACARRAFWLRAQARLMRAAETARGNGYTQPTHQHARAHAARRDRRWTTVSAATIGMGALEFGGDFSCGRPMAVEELRPRPEY